MPTNWKFARILAAALVVTGISIIGGCTQSESPVSTQPKAAADMSMVLLASADDDAVPEARQIAPISWRPAAPAAAPPTNTAPAAATETAEEMAPLAEPPSRPIPVSSDNAIAAPSLEAVLPPLTQVQLADPAEASEAEQPTPGEAPGASLEPTIVARLVVDGPSNVIKARQAEPQEPSTDTQATQGLEEEPSADANNAPRISAPADSIGANHAPDATKSPTANDEPRTTASLQQPLSIIADIGRFDRPEPIPPAAPMAPELPKPALQAEPAPPKPALQAVEVVAETAPPNATAVERPTTPAERTSRSASMALVARRAEEHVRYAFDLAQRGAAYSARSEFIQALRLIAQARDTEDGTQTHIRAFTTGLRALQEAGDFEPRDGRVESSINVAHVVASHRTSVLKDTDLSQFMPLEAMQRYYAFAKEQLAFAGSEEPIASMALYGLARLQTVLLDPSGDGKVQGGPKAIALHQAALMVDGRNYLAANELAVLLARYGELEDAQALLVHAASFCEDPEIWLNLSAVYRELGADDQSRSAKQRYETLLASKRSSARNAGTTGSTIYWVDSATFSQNTTPDGLEGPAPASAASHSAPVSTASSRNAHTPAPALSSLIPRGLRDLKTKMRLGERNDVSQDAQIRN